MYNILYVYACRLETVRCDQVEKLASLELKQQEHLNLLQSRQKRISDLEKELSNIGSSRNEWNAKILKLEEERNSLKIEFSKHVWQLLLACF
jgi:uncharacterized coiled-coil DUF342 family protein